MCIRDRLFTMANCGSVYVICKMIPCLGFCVVKQYLLREWSIGNDASGKSHVPLEISVAFYAILVLSARHFVILELRFLEVKSRARI